MQRIKKELDLSNGHYKITAAQKSHFGHSVNEKATEFLAEIQDMIDNDLSKSIWFIVRDMGVSEFLISQKVHEDIR